jgi:hypothetical protein
VRTDDLLSKLTTKPLYSTEPEEPLIFTETDDAALSDDDGVCLSACDASLDDLQTDFEDINDDVLDELNTLLQTLVARYSRRRLTPESSSHKKARLSDTIGSLADAVGERLDAEVFDAVRYAIAEKLANFKQTVDVRSAARGRP